MSKNFKPIIIIPGDPESIFYEIFFKSLKLKNYKSSLIIIGCKKSLLNEIKKFKIKKKVRSLELKNIHQLVTNNKYINIIDIPLKTKSDKHIINDYINKCFQTAFKLIKDKYTYKFLNGPINKKKFLNRKFIGITEYISEYFQKKTAMLIYHKELSVCPITTHLPIKLVTKKITKKLIEEKLILVNNFFKKILKVKPRIAITNLNPHGESILKINEDEDIVMKAVNSLKKKKMNIKGPFSADTIFTKTNRKRFDVIAGMYHDQVLAPAKTLFEYDAINITVGLPFIRVSPDHGPNKKMVGKNTSNPSSLIKALDFLDNK